MYFKVFTEKFATIQTFKIFLFLDEQQDIKFTPYTIKAYKERLSSLFMEFMEKELHFKNIYLYGSARGDFSYKNVSPFGHISEDQGKTQIIQSDNLDSVIDSFIDQLVDLVCVVAKNNAVQMMNIHAQYPILIEPEEFFF